MHPLPFWTLGWRHTLLLVRAVLVDPLEQWLPWHLNGLRSAPPEDIGSTGSYEELLEVLAKPGDEDHTAISPGREHCTLVVGQGPRPPSQAAT